MPSGGGGSSRLSRAWFHEIGRDAYLLRTYAQPEGGAGILEYPIWALHQGFELVIAANFRYFYA